MTKKLNKDNKLFSFPNLSVQGYYDPLSQSIVFCELKRQDLMEVIRDPFNLDRIHKTKLIIHEVCHYLDHITTLKGQQLLASICDAFNALKNEDAHENELWRLVRLNKLVNSLKFEKYYKNLNEKTFQGGNIKDWTLKSTIGCRYDLDGKIDISKPIIFNTFSYRGEFVGRIPFSIEALWEASSMAVEALAQIKAIQNLNNSDQQIVAANLFIKESLDWIYNSELLTYSSAAHLVGISLNIDDIAVAFRIAKTLATISLNLPDEYIQQLKAPEYLELTEERKTAFLNSNDPSCLFYRLVRNLQESRENIMDENLVNIEKILQINNLPEQQILEKAIENAMRKIGEDMLEGAHSYDFVKLHVWGTALFQEIGLDGANEDPQYLINLAQLPSMPIIFEEEDFDNENNILVNRYNHVSIMDDKIKEFIKACGY